MQNHVVTVDIAKRMKDAGWKKPVAFHWWTDEHARGRWALGRIESELIMLPAAMSTEIIEVFPRGSLEICVQEDGSLIKYFVTGIKRYRLVDALAETWLWARKEGLLK